MGLPALRSGQTGDTTSTRPLEVVTAQSTAPAGGADAVKPARIDPSPDGFELVGKKPEGEAASSAPETPTFEKPILLYNGDCAVCRTIAGFVKKETAKRGPEWDELVEMPIGNDPSALATLHPGLDIWAAYETVHVLMPDGTIKAGGEAVSEVFRRMPTTRWMTPFLDLEVFGLKPFQKLVDGGYWFLDRVRPAFGCESCGKAPPWWAAPITWSVKAYKALFGSTPDKPEGK